MKKVFEMAVFDAFQRAKNSRKLCRFQADGAEKPLLAEIHELGVTGEGIPVALAFVLPEGKDGEGAAQGWELIPLGEVHAPQVQEGDARDDREGGALLSTRISHRIQ